MERRLPLLALGLCLISSGCGSINITAEYKQPRLHARGGLLAPQTISAGEVPDTGAPTELAAKATEAQDAASAAANRAYDAMVTAKTAENAAKEAAERSERLPNVVAARAAAYELAKEAATADAEVKAMEREVSLKTDAAFNATNEVINTRQAAAAADLKAAEHEVVLKTAAARSSEKRASDAAAAAEKAKKEVLSISNQVSAAFAILRTNTSGSAAVKAKNRYDAVNANLTKAINTASHMEKETVLAQDDSDQAASALKEASARKDIAQAADSKARTAEIDAQKADATLSVAKTQLTLASEKANNLRAQAKAAEEAATRAVNAAPEKMAADVTALNAKKAAKDAAEEAAAKAEVARAAKLAADKAAASAKAADAAKTADAEAAKARAESNTAKSTADDLAKKAETSQAEAMAAADKAAKEPTDANKSAAEDAKKKAEAIQAQAKIAAEEASKKASDAAAAEKTAAELHAKLNAVAGPAGEGDVTAFFQLEADADAAEEFGKVFAQCFYVGDVVVQNNSSNTFVAYSSSLEMHVKYYAAEEDYALVITNQTVAAKTIKDEGYIPAIRRPATYADILAIFEFQRQSNKRQQWLNWLKTFGEIATGAEVFVGGAIYPKAISFATGIITPQLEKRLLWDFIMHARNLEARSFKEVEQIAAYTAIHKIVFFPKRPIPGIVDGFPVYISSFDPHAPVAIKGTLIKNAGQAESKLKP